VVLRELSIEEGAVFRQRQVTDSQRRLATLQILQFASVTARAPEGAVVSRIPVELTVVENPPRVLQLGAGYGSEDRFRASAQWSHLNFLGQARQASAEAKWSSIDRGAKVSLSQPYWFRRGLAIEAEGASWWTHESTYDSRTFGGRIGVSYRFGERRPGRGRLVGNRVRAGYAREYLRYNIRPETLEDLTNVDELIALGLDPVSGRGRGVNAAIELTYDRNAADDLRDPRSGYGASVHVAHARPWLGGTFHYDEILADGRTYLPVARRIVVALRARVGTLAAGTDADVPFSARYFLGGSTSLRGWGRYQVAPLSNGVPIGGRTTFDSSVEARVQIRGPFGAVAFFDAGNVWPGTWDVDFHDLRSSVGIGLRYGTPIGLVRGDIASQVSRVPGLLIDGLPEERHWRLHLSLGQAF
jgi:outer membrane protein assembly factor BamA